MKKKGIIYLIIVFLFMYAPIAVSILFSFNSTDSMAVFESFSLNWYKELFSNQEAIQALMNTLILAVSSSVLATFLGTFAAIGIHKMKNKFAKKTLMTITNIPMMNPDIVTGVSIMLLFAFVITFCNLNAFGFPAMLIAHVTFNLPYVILCVLPKLKQMDKNLPEAAMDLGCTPLKAFTKVEFFEILPGILSGLMLSFTLSVDDFVISYFVSGESFQTLPIYIYSQTKRRVSPDMNALFAIIFVVILVIILVVLRNLSYGEMDFKKISKNGSVQIKKSNNKVKKIIALVVASVIFVSFVGLVIFSSNYVIVSDFEVTEETASIDYSKYEGITLNVYNWGEYIPDGSEDSINLNAEFTRLTGIKVNYTNYSSNEDMRAKLLSGGVNYDVIVPSDYMIERLIAEDMLLELNYDNIPNYKYISENYKNLYYDPTNSYTVPWCGGTVGIIYNTELVDYVPDSWEIFMDEDLAGEILMFNNPRDAFMIAQFALGISINSESEDDWEKALKWLIEQKEYVKAYVMDEVFNKMESGSAAVSAYYAGDYLTMYGNNESLAFAYPKEGTNFFVDCACIPACSKNKEAAELYINFLLDPNVALEIAEFVLYASPHTAVIENEEYIEYMEEYHPDAMAITYPDFDSIYPDSNVNDYYYHNFTEETNAVMADKWKDLKIAQTEEASSSWLYWTSGILAALIIAFFVWRYFVKIKRKIS